MKLTLVGRWVAGIALLYGALVLPHATALQMVSQDNKPHQAEGYVIRPSDKDRARKVAEVREFLWQHWQQHHPGSLLVTWYSKEGKASKTTYTLEPDDHL